MGLSLTPCDRNSAWIVGQPRPADDARRTDVGYFLDPCVRNSMGSTETNVCVRSIALPCHQARTIGTLDLLDDRPSQETVGSGQDPVQIGQTAMTKRSPPPCRKCP